MTETFTNAYPTVSPPSLLVGEETTAAQQIINWVRGNGPATVDQIKSGTGLGEMFSCVFPVMVAFKVLIPPLPSPARNTRSNP